MLVLKFDKSNLRKGVNPEKVFSLGDLNYESYFSTVNAGAVVYIFPDGRMLVLKNRYSGDNEEVLRIARTN